MKLQIKKTGLALTLVIAAMGAHAAPVNYGDFNGDNVSYNQVTEDTDFGNYGSPLIAGDTITFNPTDLDAGAANGSTEQNIAMLDFDIQADAGKYVNTILFSEAGNVTLNGPPNNGTSAEVTADFTISILNVDGVAIAGGPVTDTLSMTFSPSDGSFELLTDGGGPPFYSTPWNGSIMIDLGSILDSQSVIYTDGATLAHLVLNNTLVANSIPGGSSVINKNVTSGLSIISDVIPEPASIGLMGTAGLLIFIRRRFIA